MTTKKKSVLEWLGIFVGICTTLGIITAFSRRIDKVERLTKQVPGEVWDLQLLKGAFNRTYPTQYDSALSNQIKINGPRPAMEDE